MYGHYSLGLSKQAIAVYTVLLKHKLLAAKAIGKHLRIAPHSVYRLTEHLKAIGFIEQLDTHPVTYKANLPNEAQENYLLQQRKWVTNLFAESAVNVGASTIQDNESFAISFIQGRAEQLEQIAKDIEKTQHSAKYIISALPISISTELMYRQQQAIKRGVDLQILAQEHTAENHAILLSYKHNGAEIRVGKSFGWHLFLFDDEVTHIMLYDSTDKTKQFGVRFVHRGINEQLHKIFEEQWRKAVPIE